MAKKREYEFILGVLLFLMVGAMVFGQVVKPESVGDFIGEFVQVFWLLIMVPLLVLAWRDIDVRASKVSKRWIYYFWVLAVLLVLAAGLNVWSIWGVERKGTIIEKAWDIMFPLYVCAWVFIYIIKYIKAGKAGTRGYDEVESNKLLKEIVSQDGKRKATIKLRDDEKYQIDFYKFTQEVVGGYGKVGPPGWEPETDPPKSIVDTLTNAEKIAAERLESVSDEEPTDEVED